MVDFVSELFSRNLIEPLELICENLGHRDLSNAIRACKEWRHILTHEVDVWNRLLGRRYRSSQSYRTLCRLTGWHRYLEPGSGADLDPRIPILAHYAATDNQEYLKRLLETGRFRREARATFTGHIISVVRILEEWMVCGCEEGMVKVWHLKRLDCQASKVFYGHKKAVRYIAGWSQGPSQDCRQVFATSSWDRTLRLWSFETGSQLRLIHLSEPVDGLVLFSHTLLAAYAEKVSLFEMTSVDHQNCFAIDIEEKASRSYGELAWAVDHSDRRLVVATERTIRVFSGDERTFCIEEECLKLEVDNGCGQVAVRSVAIVGNALACAFEVQWCSHRLDLYDLITKSLVWRSCPSLIIADVAMNVFWFMAFIPHHGFFVSSFERFVTSQGSDLCQGQEVKTLLSFDDDQKIRSWTHQLEFFLGKRLEISPQGGHIPTMIIIEEAKDHCSTLYAHSPKWQ